MDSSAWAEGTTPPNPNASAPSSDAGLIRLYYETESGRVIEIENRPDDDYTDENVSRPDMTGISTIVVHGSKLDGLNVDELTVSGNDVRASEGTELSDRNLARRRIDEIRATDKSNLSDDEWLAIFREYMTLTGGF